ncbi:hypothetical protein D3C80_1466520 [compost metagenome]
MHPYTNHHNSGILSYSIGTDYIVVKFNTGGIYTYSYKSAGISHVERMKDLAQKGRGLNTYISRFVKDLYD